MSGESCLQCSYKKWKTFVLQVTLRVKTIGYCKKSPFLNEGINNMPLRVNHVRNRVSMKSLSIVLYTIECYKDVNAFSFHRLSTQILLLFLHVFGSVWSLVASRLVVSEDAKLWSSCSFIFPPLQMFAFHLSRARRAYRFSSPGMPGGFSALRLVTDNAKLHSRYLGFVCP